MDSKKRFMNLKTKIMISTLIPVIVSFVIIGSVLFTSLFNSFHETAKSEFLQISQKYAVSFERKINNAMNYLSIVSSILELQVESEAVDREMLQKTVQNIFEDYELIDGSSIYFEPNSYDGRDTEYIGSEYGSAMSGRICYYFYMDDGGTAYLPEALDNDIEFTLPHYTEAKETNKPIYTRPVVYEIDGRDIPMFTLTYPVRDKNNIFIGAVTVDLFLEDIYAQLQNEVIYKTGYIVIANDKEWIIYSPVFEDVGKNREEAGVDYTLPTGNETAVYSNAKSIINGKSCFITTSSIYIPQLDSFFYISVAAPTKEINAAGTRLMFLHIIFSTVIIIVIALLVYYLIGRISAPIKEITESANKIAKGNLDEANAIVSGEKHIDTKDEVSILFMAIKKMLTQLNEVQELKLQTLELKHKKEKAEAAAQAKNDFLAKMSHEIRTPMNAVMGMIELILRRELPQDVYENALIIKSAGTNLLSIINDILDFSKIESGMLEIIDTDYLFPSLINDVISIIRIRLVDKPIQFAVNIDSGIPISLKGDEIRIRQMLLNLLNNAVKYTNEGYISLTVTGTVSENMVMLVMDISDSGIGIKDEDIDKLFGDFVQIDMTKNKGIEGTGLGLAISRSLCRAMGGDITIHSKYGKGSIFTVTIPQKFETYEPFAVISHPDEKSVLLYETRQVYKDSIIKTLDNLGISYTNVENIPSLFEHLESCPYVFISSFMYGSVNPALTKTNNPPTLVLLADITETFAPKDARVLTMPAHSLSIANILNDIYEDYGSNAVTGASFIAPEANILIVDDIMANLKVAEGLLLPYEMQITLCKNGREAIELIMTNQYDLVFMDHMMPEMDGLEATGHIRAMEGEYYKSLPIIALTANAVSGVREMFIQNGMSDFIAKPIETVKLDAILEKWIPKEKRKRITISEQAEDESGFINVLKGVSELSVDKALSAAGGSMITYRRILTISIRLLPENITRLNEFIDTDLSKYAIEVHGVKGVLNTIGAFELGKMALELEELSKEGNFDACQVHHLHFNNKLIKFSNVMIALIDKEEFIDKQEGDKLYFLESLQKLEKAVDFFDSTLALEILLPFNRYTYGQSVDSMVADLKRAFECFDFDKAAELMEELKGEMIVYGL